MADAPRPVNLAIIVCDSIIDDRKTGKKTLVGVFNRIAAGSFPCVHHSLSVFVSLTDGRGEYEAELRCVNSATEQPIVEAKGKVGFRNPNDVVEIGFELRGLKFPEPGLYQFEFLCNGEPIGQRPFIVEEIK